MSAKETEAKVPPDTEDALVAALRVAAGAVRELPAALDSALDVLGEAVRQAAGPHPPDRPMVPDNRGSGDQGAGPGS